MFTTAENLARWSQALFRDGRVLSERSLNQMLTFHSPTPGDPFIAGYGFGVTRFSPDLTNGVEVWGHLGTGGGFGAACLYLPDYRVSIGIMANTDAGDAAMLTLKEFLKVTTSHLEPSS